MTNDEQLRKYLGISTEDIDPEKVTELLIDSFVYHEGMADLSLNTINKKALDKAESKDGVSILWDAFETNNALAYAMRGILLKASEKPSENF